jgi:outer membrane protein
VKWLIIPVFVGLFAAPAAAEPRRITLEEAISLAAGHSPAVAIGAEQVIVAEEHLRSTRTLRLPTLGVSANVLLWNDEIAFQLDPMAPPTVVRGQVTAQIDVTIAQPITAIFLLDRLLDLERASVAVARAELDTARLDAAYQAAETYLSALEVETLREVAAISVAQIEANLVQVRALRGADLMSDVDVLRLEAQRDQIRQQVLEASVGAKTARRGLVVLLGLPASTDLDLAPVDLTPPELRWTEDEAIARARRRPEARAAEARVEQAAVGVDVVKSEYLPNVNAFATYSHTEGQGVFGIPDSAFAGIQLQWNLWDWGRRAADLRQARATQRIAERARDALDDQLSFDVRAKWLTASSRKETLTVAESGLRAAEEAHRLQQVRFGEGAATTTDVIDAEADVARARAQATISRYQYLIAWMALARAVGEQP